MPDRPASWVREPEGDSVLEKNWLFELRRERTRSRASGTAHDFYVLDLADSVNVIALNLRREVVMVEQYRAGSRRDGLETPGGLIDAGEDPLEAAVRELREETGYVGDPPRLLGWVWSNPSLMTARSFTVVITDAYQAHEPKPDHGEEVRVELVPSRRVPWMIRNGRIGHALSVVGLLWWLASEIPHTPLELPPLEKRSGQFGIGAIMWMIAVIGLVLAMGRMAFQTGNIYLGFVVSVLLIAMPVAYLVQRLWLGQPHEAVLLRESRMALSGLLGRLFSWIGLTVVLCCAAGCLGYAALIILANFFAW